MQFLTTGFQIFSEILTAGIAITAFSLLLYALSFNLRDRVARSFALLLACIVVVFTGEVLGGVSGTYAQSQIWYRIQWVGLVFIPATFMHFSDALLAKTGRPSRGRRRNLVRTLYAISTAFLLALPYGLLVGDLVTENEIWYLTTAPLTTWFALYYGIGTVWAWGNVLRAYRRTSMPTSLRRMRYLVFASLGPPVASFPYLLFGAGIAVIQPIVFWIMICVMNILLAWMLVLMAYAVAFFGVAWPDRVVKRRLVKWILRGPVTASTALAVMTFVWRGGQFLGMPDTVMAPVVMVFSVLVLEHLISLSGPFWERFLFEGDDQENIELVQNLEARLLTINDLRQFLEAVLAALCDQFQVTNAFAAALNTEGVDLLVQVGDEQMLEIGQILPDTINAARRDTDSPIFAWETYFIVPLYHYATEDFIGLIGVERRENTIPDPDQQETLTMLSRRSALALSDRLTQQKLFTSLKDLTPQVELIQRMRAAARYDQNSVLAQLEDLPEPVELSESVKDALSHYWGGPKLSDNPLTRLTVVQKALDNHEGNTVNALRSILKEAIEQVRPQGERRFTAEWILYNILELKFMQGRKVREVAMRLAVSEADLYRKQRVAVQAVAEAILAMEKKALEESIETVETDDPTNELRPLIEHFTND